MTKNWLEFDRKKFTLTSLNVGTRPKNLHRQTLTFELDPNMDEFFQKLIKNFGQIQRLMFVGVNFLVMFKIFSHIGSLHYHI